MINCARKQMCYSAMTVRNRTAHYFFSNKTSIVVLQYPLNEQLGTGFNNRIFCYAKTLW